MEIFRAVLKRSVPSISNIMASPFMPEHPGVIPPLLWPGPSATRVTGDANRRSAYVLGPLWPDGPNDIGSTNLHHDDRLGAASNVRYSNYTYLCMYIDINCAGAAQSWLTRLSRRPAVPLRTRPTGQPPPPSTRVLSITTQTHHFFVIKVLCRWLAADAPAANDGRTMPADSHC